MGGSSRRESVSGPGRGRGQVPFWALGRRPEPGKEEANITRDMGSVSGKDRNEQNGRWVMAVDRAKLPIWREVLIFWRSDQSSRGW